MSLFTKSMSSKPTSKGHVLSNEEHNVVTMALHNWNLPKVPTHKIYKQEKFKFYSDSKIITKEQQLSLSVCGGFIGLSSQLYLHKYRYKYNYLHVGMVQVAVKTLTKKPLNNSSIILCLLDDRNTKFQDTILGMVESSLNDGPVYFNCFPNMTVALEDLSMDKALLLRFKINGFEELPSSQPVILSYRMCYKVMKSEFGSQALAESPIGKTVLFQTKVKNSDSNGIASNKVGSKTMKWDEVQVPSNWAPEKEAAVEQLKREAEARRFKFTVNGRSIVSYR